MFNNTLELLPDAIRNEEGFYPILVNGKQEKVPSVTKLIRRPFGYSTEAMVRGTLIHNALNEIVVNGKDPASVVDKETASPVKQFISMLTADEIEIICGEEVNIGSINGLYYVGKLDLYVKSRGIKKIKDFKTQENPTDKAPDDNNLIQSWLYARSKEPNEYKELEILYEDGWIQRGVYDPSDLMTEGNRILHTFYGKVDGWYWENGGCYRKKTLEQEEALEKLALLLQEKKYYEKDKPKPEKKYDWKLNRMFKEQAYRGYPDFFRYCSRAGGTVYCKYTQSKDSLIKLPPKPVGRFNLKDAILEAREIVKKVCGYYEEQKMAFRHRYMTVYETKDSEYFQFKKGKKDELMAIHPEWFFKKEIKEEDSDYE